MIDLFPSRLIQCLAKNCARDGFYCLKELRLTCKKLNIKVIPLLFMVINNQSTQKSLLNAQNIAADEKLRYFVRAAVCDTTLCKYLTQCPNLILLSVMYSCRYIRPLLEITRVTRLILGGESNALYILRFTKLPWVKNVLFINYLIPEQDLSFLFPEIKELAFYSCKVDNLCLNFKKLTYLRFSKCSGKSIDYCPSLLYAVVHCNLIDPMKLFFDPNLIKRIFITDVNQSLWDWLCMISFPNLLVLELQLLDLEFKLCQVILNSKKLTLIILHFKKLLKIKVEPIRYFLLNLDYEANELNNWIKNQL